jgi:hypothetical protein
VRVGADFRPDLMPVHDAGAQAVKRGDGAVLGGRFRFLAGGVQVLHVRVVGGVFDGVEGGAGGVLCQEGGE